MFCVFFPPWAGPRHRSLRDPAHGGGPRRWHVFMLRTYHCAAESLSIERLSQFGEIGALENRDCKPELLRQLRCHRIKGQMFARQPLVADNLAPKTFPIHRLNFLGIQKFIGVFIVHAFNVREINHFFCAVRLSQKHGVIISGMTRPPPRRDND